jgi:hypothetical protein
VDEAGVPSPDPAAHPLADVAGTLIGERSVLASTGGFCDVEVGGDEEMVARLDLIVGHAGLARVDLPLVISTASTPTFAAPEPFRTRFRRAHYFGAVDPASICSVD